MYYIDIKGVDTRKLKIRKYNRRMRYPVGAIVGGFDTDIEAWSFMREYSDDFLARDGYFIVCGDGRRFFGQITAESKKNHEIIVMTVIEKES